MVLKLPPRPGVLPIAQTCVGRGAA